MNRFEISFPDDVENSILLLADALSLLRARLVCRRWKTLIDKQEFAETHARLHIRKAAPLVIGFYAETRIVTDLTAGRFSKIRESTVCCYNPFGTEGRPGVARLLAHESPEHDLEWASFASAGGLVFLATQTNKLLFAVYNPLKRDSLVLLPLPDPNHHLLPPATFSMASMTRSPEDFSYTIYMSLNRRLHIFSSATWSWRVLDYLASLGWENWAEACCNMLLDEKTSTIWMLGANAAATSFGIICYNLLSEELRVVHEWSEEEEEEQGNNTFRRFLQKVSLRRALARNEKNELLILEEKPRVLVFRNNSVDELSPDLDSAAPVLKEFGAPTGVAWGSMHLWMDSYSCRDFLVDLKTSSGWACSAKVHRPSWLSERHISGGKRQAIPSKMFKRQVLSFVPTML